jgi:hypothetical protein
MINRKPREQARTVASSFGLVSLMVAASMAERTVSGQLLTAHSREWQPDATRPQGAVVSTSVASDRKLGSSAAPPAAVARSARKRAPDRRRKKAADEDPWAKRPVGEDEILADVFDALAPSLGLLHQRECDEAVKLYREHRAKVLSRLMTLRRKCNRAQNLERDECTQELHKTS